MVFRYFLNLKPLELGIRQHDYYLANFPDLNVLQEHFEDWERVVGDWLGRNGAKVPVVKVS